jgi:hypothetical protein
MQKKQLSFYKENLDRYRYPYSYRNPHGYEKIGEIWNAYLFETLKHIRKPVGYRNPVLDRNPNEYGILSDAETLTLPVGLA